MNRSAFCLTLLAAAALLAACTPDQRVAQMATNVAGVSLPGQAAPGTLSRRAQTQATLERVRPGASTAPWPGQASAPSRAATGWQPPPPPGSPERGEALDAAAARALLDRKTIRVRSASSTSGMIWTWYLSGRQVFETGNLSRSALEMPGNLAIQTRDYRWEGNRLCRQINGAFPCVGVERLRDGRLVVVNAGNQIESFIVETLPGDAFQIAARVARNEREWAALPEAERRRILANRQWADEAFQDTMDDLVQRGLGPPPMSDGARRLQERLECRGAGFRDC
jgi:hypothetical protein